MCFGRSRSDKSYIFPQRTTNSVIAMPGINNIQNSADSDTNPNTQPFGVGNELSSHPVIYVIVVVGVALVLGQKKLKNLVKVVPDKYQLPVKLTDFLVTYITDLFPGYIIRAIGIFLLGCALYARLWGQLWDFVVQIDKDIFPSLRPDKEFIYLLLSTAALVTVAIALVSWTLYSNRSLNQQVAALKTAKEDLVSSVEDATRHVLQGFPEIFDRALALLQEADREIWLINFALNFGEPHLINEEVCSGYDERPATEKYKALTDRTIRNLKEDVRLFFKTLEMKVRTIEKVYILTINDDSIVSAFLSHLYNRPGYSKRFNKQEDKTSHINDFKERISRAKRDILTNMRHRDKLAPGPEGSNPDGRFYEVDNLPLQLLIAGKKGKTSVAASCSWSAPRSLKALREKYLKRNRSLV